LEKSKKETYQGGHMVVVVQENEWSLAQHNKNGVQQLGDLAQAKVEHPRIRHLGGKVAHVGRDALFKCILYDGRNNVDGTSNAEQRQQDVPETQQNL